MDFNQEEMEIIQESLRYFRLKVTEDLRVSFFEPKDEKLIREGLVKIDNMIKKLED